MTSELELILRGEGAASAAHDLQQALSTDGETVTLAARAPEALPEAARKAIDPISLAALIVAIPAAVLSAWDLGDRIKKRKRAETLLQEAKRLRVEKRVETYVVTLEGPKALDTLDPDRLLELAMRLENPGAD
jgi:hypothetical protein